MRYKLTLQYDGSNYAGWQIQKNAAKTLQGTLIETLTTVLSNHQGKFQDLQGAGRTDAGVHAYGQVAHLVCQTSLSAEALQEEVNALLPPSLHILRLEPAPDRFHARHWADSRQYLYRISLRRNPFERKFVCWVKEDLNTERMAKALQDLKGFHDFASFSRKPKQEKSTEVLMEQVECVQEDDLILIRLRGSHFLWNMVRNIVGTAVEVGKGNLSEDIFSQALSTYNPELKNYRMPASGLFLEEVRYRQRP